MTDPLRDRVTVAVGDAYDIDVELGRGGMAVVYRATDLRLRRRVAIKVLPPEFAFRDDVRRRFLREAETAAQLVHPNIVPIYAVDERGGVVFFVMALVAGESLAARLARPPRLTIGEVQRILHDVADALAYAHAHGVVHRDIKPDNILIDRDSGRPMVTDFGIARAAEADSRLTVTGVAVGTPAYMSPEQATGDRELDGRSDIYSLGVVGYQMLTGQLPFTASNTPAMMLKHLSEMPRSVRELRPDVPAPLAQAVERALGKRAEDRWPNAAMFRDAVVSTREQAAPMAPPSHAAPDAPRAPWETPDRPALMTPREWKAARREWKQYARAQRQEARAQQFTARPVEERIVIFRRNLVGTGAIVTMLAGINLLTSPWFPWFIFPMIGMGGSLVHQWSNLWSAGVRWKDIFNRPATAVRVHSARWAVVIPERPSAPRPDERAAALEQLAPSEVLAGPHGAAIRKAVADRAAVLSIFGALAKEDRALLPDIVPTVNALVDRAASLAQLLHHLDADASPALLRQLEQRIEAVRSEPVTAVDRERRLALLERQQLSLRELAERRARLEGQLESAGLALQNLKFDLLKLRSSGVQSALGEVTSATMEARALSREIGHVLDAAEEIRRL